MVAHPQKDFAALLKEHRKEERGWTQLHLAKKVGFDKSYISQLERHVRVPPPWTALSLAVALELTGEEQEIFLEAARRARARDLESMDVRIARRLLERVPPLPRRARSPVGREQEIRAIVDRLAGPGVIAITGDPAIEKTTVALEVAHHYRQQGRIVVWGDAREGTADSVAQVQVLIWDSVVGGRMPGNDVVKEKRFSAALSRHRPLIALDNLESAREFNGIVELAGRLEKVASVLITSRRWIPAHIGDNISLFELPEVEGVQLFESVGRAYGRRPETERDRRIIEIICGGDILAGHPGAIEIAASLWKGWPLEAILRGLRQRAMDTLEDRLEPT